jgi:hypothetical protein
MERTVKIFTACALGAGIGTLIALQLSGYFSWIGPLVGGFIGYLAYDYKKVIEAVKIAWDGFINWRPNKKDLKLFLKAWISFCYCLASVISGFFVGMVGLIMLYDVDATSRQELVFILLLIMAGCIFFVVPILSFMTISHDYGDSERMNLSIQNSKMMFPYQLYCVTIPKGIIFLIKKIPVVVVTIVKFAKTVFILIHSERRLLCGVDAAIGAAIGYYAGNAIVGALAGGVFGVVNYLIVSIGILGVNKN